MNPAKDSRNEEIAMRVLDGEPTPIIARENGISTTRVRQLTTRWFRRELPDAYDDVVKASDTDTIRLTDLRREWGVFKESKEWGGR